MGEIFSLQNIDIFRMIVLGIIFLGLLLIKLKGVRALLDSRVVFLLSLVCFFYAFMNVMVQNTALDSKRVVFVLDISKSMFAKDLYPSRLEVAIKKLTDFLQDSRICSSIIVFGQNAYLLSPYSCDVLTQSALLESVPRNFLQQGLFEFDNGSSNLNLALSMASLYGQKIVLLSDGDTLPPVLENPDSELLLWLFASKQGSVIERDSRLLRDLEGKIVISAPSSWTEDFPNIVDFAYNHKDKRTIQSLLAYKQAPIQNPHNMSLFIVCGLGLLFAALFLLRREF
ncbi:MAG: VWA domain-containing protein [Helicobacter sp.]|nr:VWA domain-containing protein [Helicobacter sp.]MDD7568216.1 VWA domain-containing protein [Helicobacter sp.]MDY5740262.1 VWA domain-containing protein [Helicobacter sp.]